MSSTRIGQTAAYRRTPCSAAEDCEALRNESVPTGSARLRQMLDAAAGETLEAIGQSRTVALPPRSDTEGWARYWRNPTTDVDPDLVGFAQYGPCRFGQQNPLYLEQVLR